MPDRTIIRAFLSRDDSLLSSDALLPVVKAPTRPAASASSAGMEKKIAVRILQEAVEPADGAPLSGPAVRWARKVLQDIIAPVAKAIPKQHRTAKAPPGSVAAVFQNAVHAVPQRGEAASLADAFDEAKRQKDVGVYGTRINPPQKATGPTHA
jgi:hypothetical protein